MFLKENHVAYGEVVRIARRNRSGCSCLIFELRGTKTSRFPRDDSINVIQFFVIASDRFFVDSVIRRIIRIVIDVI